nr:MAG TPA: hypothetical protein [Caudoviricetes sp.]DAV65231.1 MAG TPA: hypothetical protein [Caudoviricetes sp.]
MKEHTILINRSIFSTFTFASISKDSPGFIRSRRAYTSSL